MSHPAMTSRKASVLLSLLFGAALPFAQTAQPETARQVLIQMFVASERDAFARHLTDETRTKLTEIGLDGWLARPPIEVREGQSLQAFETGPVLMIFLAPNTVEGHPSAADKLEVAVVENKDSGDTVLFELRLNRLKEGEEPASRSDPQFKIKMTLEHDMWMISDIEISRELQQSLQRANGEVAVNSLRALNVAEITYQTQYGHFTCSLADFGGELPGQPDEHHAMLIERRLASGAKDGYLFRISGCNAQGTRYRISAVPAKSGVSGTRAYCTDSSGFFWYSEDGNAETCFSARRLLADAPAP